jgi:hypothetical protein
MSPQSRGASVQHVDPSAFLEHLPLPCLFVALDRNVVFANAAARRLVLPTGLPGGHVSSLPNGASILQNAWLTALGLPDPSGLDLHLRQLQEQQQQRVEQEARVAGSYVPPTLTLPFVSRGTSAAIFTWILSCCQIDGTSYYSLTAAPSAIASVAPDYTRQSSEEEDWAMLQAM